MCKPTHTLPTMDQHYQKNLQQLDSILMLRRVSQLSALSMARQLQQAPVPAMPPPAPGLPSIRSLPANSRRTVFLPERQQFLVFTKVLFKYLAKANVDPRHAKRVVAKCIRENREGRSASLVDTLEIELRKCLGELHWHRANKCFKAYCSKLGVQPINANAIRAV